MASGTDEALHCTGSVLSGNKDDYLNTIIFYFQDKHPEIVQWLISLT